MAASSILVFLLLFFRSGIIFNDFYKMPAIGSFSGGAFCSFRSGNMSFDEKAFKVMSRGAGHENIMMYALIFLLAGAFSGSVRLQAGSRAL